MKTATKSTQVDRIKKADLSQKQKVCEILMWTEEMYFDFMFQQYNDFLNRLFFGYPTEFLNNVCHSPIFRGFWNNEVSHRNENEFMPFALKETEDEFYYDENGEFVAIWAMPFGDSYLVDEFMLIHNPKTLMSDDAFMHRYNRTLGLI